MSVDACASRGRTVIAGYYLSVRLAGTAIICILAAFGAAFLVARAVNHDAPARAATPPRTTNVADTTARVAPSHKVNVELISQFAPIKGPKLKPRPKPKPKHKKHKPKPVVSYSPPASSTATTPTYTTSAPTYTAPSYTPPATSAPTHTSSGTTHHKKSGSSGGSGTTTIGG